MNENGYTIIDLEDYSLAEQINYFYHAEDIIGVHGAGFAHMCFTKAPVLDIIVENFYMGYFEKLSETFGLKYEYLRCKGVENDFPNKTPGYHDIIIDIDGLKNHISHRNL
jgi:capsular polysaccharide biosynthesis protein